MSRPHDLPHPFFHLFSVNLLDICNAYAFSSEISRLNQGHLLLRCVLHNLDSSSSKQFIKARSSLDAWRQHISSKNPRVENCSTILNSAKWMVLMRAMYGVMVETVFICSVFASAFYGSTRKLFDLNVDDKYLSALPVCKLALIAILNIYIQVEDLQF